MNAVVLDDAHVGEGAVVAAGSVVTEGTEVPPETLVAGAPAEVKTELDGSVTGSTVHHYAQLGETYKRTSERLD